MAAATASGGDDGARSSCERARERREWARGRAREAWRGCVASFGRSRRRGEKQEVAQMRAGGERVPLSSWREEGDDWHDQLAGPACWAAGPGQVSFSLFLVCFCFLIF